MAKNSIKIKAKNKGGKTEVKALVKHNMETGLRKNKKTGKMIPAHYIQEVTCSHNGTDVMTADWGTAISKNPYLSFKFTGAASGDTLKMSWVDNKAESDSVEAKIK